MIGFLVLAVFTLAAVCLVFALAVEEPDDIAPVRPSFRALREGRLGALSAEVEPVRLGAFFPEQRRP